MKKDGETERKKRYVTSTSSNYNPHRCNESTCTEQRKLIDDDYSHLKYKDKFDVLNRCLHCITFWSKGLRVCPCCRKGLRFRPKKHNKKKGYGLEDNEIIGY